MEMLAWKASISSRSISGTLASKVARDHDVVVPSSASETEPAINKAGEKIQDMYKEVEVTLDRFSTLWNGAQD